MGELTTKEILTYAAQGKVFAGEAFCLRNSRLAKVRARDVRSLCILHGEIAESHTSLQEYRQVYRTYMNAQRQHRRDDEVPEQRQEKAEKPAATHTIAKKDIPMKGVETVHGRRLDGRWWAARAPGDPWPDGTFDTEGDAPFAPRGRMLAYERGNLRRDEPQSPRLQRRPCGCLRVSTNHSPESLVEFPGR